MKRAHETAFARPMDGQSARPTNTVVRRMAEFGYDAINSPKSLPCLLPFPTATLDGWPLPLPDEVTRQAKEILACLPQVMASSMPQLRAARAHMPGIPEDVCKTLLKLHYDLAQSSLAQRRQHSREQILAIACDIACPPQQVMERITALIDQVRDVEVTLVGVPISRLDLVIKAISQASKLRSLVLDAAIRSPDKNPRDHYFFTEMVKLLTDLSASGRPFPPMSLKLSALDSTPIEPYFDGVPAQVMGVQKVLQAMINPACMVYSLALQTPLPEGSSVAMDLLRVVRYAPALRSLWLEINSTYDSEFTESCDKYALAMEYLASELANKTNIKALNFRCNEIAPGGMFVCAKEMALLLNTTEWVPAEQRFFQQTITAGLTYTRSLESFSLDDPNQPMPPGNRAALMAGLRANRSLIEINLKAPGDWNQDQLADLLAIVASHPKLKRLNFCRVDLDETALRQIREFHQLGHKTPAGVVKKIDIEGQFPYDPEDVKANPADQNALELDDPQAIFERE